MSCLARERLFEHFSIAQGTKTVLLRLNYATEMRYGLLVDLARKLASGIPIDLTMGHMNVIWQGDANAMALASLAHAASPAAILNLAGPGASRGSRRVRIARGSHGRDGTLHRRRQRQTLC